MWASSNLQLLSVPYAILRDSVEEEVCGRGKGMRNIRHYFVFLILQRRRRLIEQSNNLLRSLKRYVFIW